MKKIARIEFRVRTAMALVAACLLIGTPVWGRRGPRLAKAPDYTKGERPATKDTQWAIGPTGAFGFFYYSDARQVLIGDVAKDSPAKGNLNRNDVILGVLSPTTGQDTGEGKFTWDARRSMAIAIEQAQKKEHGGKLVLNVWRPKGEVVVTKSKKGREIRKFKYDEPITGEIIPVTMILPVMGNYSATSPFECEKTEALITKSAEAILKGKFYWRNKRGSKQPLGISMVTEALGLLATGEETYFPPVREYAQLIARHAKGLDIYSTEKRHNTGSWYTAYYGLFLSEYYLLTKDESVLPAIKSYATYLATGVSGMGTWGHGVVDVKREGMYGPLGGYGAMNQVSQVCAMFLVLAQKCGVNDPVVEKAIELALRHFSFYVDKGVMPYGDHPPTGGFDNNGRMSAAAVLFDLAGKKKQATYFTKMTLGSYRSREGGHAGNFFSWQWGALGAARGGRKAAASFAKNIRYFTELERRYDGRCVYQPQLPDQSHKNYGYRTTGQRLMQYCLPRKALYITGKGGSCVSPITDEELKRIVSAPLFNPKKLSTQELLAALGHELPPVREQAAKELGNRDDNVVDKLIVMLKSPNRYDRYGASMGLSFAGRNSGKAFDALVDILENDKDMTSRFFALKALKMPQKGKEAGNGLGRPPERVINSLLKLAAVHDPEQDPTRKMGRFISEKLFEVFGGGWFGSGGYNFKKLDKAVLYPALRSLLINPNGSSRSAAASVLHKIPSEDLDQLWDVIYECTTTSVPSGAMFADHAHVRGLELMAKHRIKEGLDYGIWFTLYKHGWGGRHRKRAIPAILPYGMHLKDHFERIQHEIKYAKPPQERAVKEFLKRIRKDPPPPPKLVSIKEHIKNKPENGFIIWMEKEKSNRKSPEKLKGGK